VTVSKEHHQWLIELTSLPTVGGHEDRVVAWVRRWAARRKNVVLEADRFGNLHLSRKGAASAGRRPIYFTGHMDHPSFVVTRVLGEHALEADFRGGVEDRFFLGAGVLLHHGDRPPQRGTVTELRVRTASRLDRNVTVTFAKKLAAAPGDILMWHTGPAKVVGGRLHVTACDDLGGCAAALAAFDVLLGREGKKGVRGDVRVLLTRAEEIGFVGAIAACKAGAISKTARLLTLETSKSFAESPIGGGPVVRVGDKTSTFDPDLTYRLSRIAEELAKTDKTFRWQRKLMPGGTCEASAFQAYGYAASALCVPLGNYHNMNDRTGRIGAESISLADFDGLVRLLAAVGEQLDDAKRFPALKTRLDESFAKRKTVLRKMGE
jgi:endoglucanase